MVETAKRSQAARRAERFAARDGKGLVEGTVKTLFDDVRILSLGEIDGPEDAPEAFWEGLVELGAELLENQPKGKVAAYVPLSGRSDDLGSDVVTIAASVLRNAFIAAMRPAIDEVAAASDEEEVASPEEAQALAEGREAQRSEALEEDGQADDDRSAAALAANPPAEKPPPGEPLKWTAVDFALEGLLVAVASLAWQVD